MNGYSDSLSRSIDGGSVGKKYDFNVQMVFLCEMIYPGLHSTIIFFFSDVQMSCLSFSGSLAIIQIRRFFIESTCEISKNCMGILIEIP